MWTPLVLCALAAVTVAQQMHKVDVKQCPDHSNAEDITVKSAEVSDLVPGETPTVKTTVVVKKKLSANAKIKVTIKTSSGSELPCVLGLGSCEYKMCGGDSEIEQLFAAAWDNKCPIKPKEYNGDTSFKLPWIVKLVVGDGNLHIRTEAIDGGKTVGCIEYDIHIKV